MTTANPVNPEFDKLMKVAAEIVREKKIDASSLISLATSLAVEANSLASLSGSQKKQLVLDVVKAKLDESVKASIDLSGSPLVATELLYVADHALPVFLDTLVLAARGKIDLKKAVLKKVDWRQLLSCVSCSGCVSVQVAEPAAPVVSSSAPAPVPVPAPSPQGVSVVKDPVVVPIELKVNEILQQSNPLHEKQQEMNQEKSVDTETPPPKNTDTVTEAPNVVEVSPATPPEKVESSE